MQNWVSVANRCISSSFLQNPCAQRVISGNCARCHVSLDCSILLRTTSNSHRLFFTCQTESTWQKSGEVEKRDKKNGRRHSRSCRKNQNKRLGPLDTVSQSSPRLNPIINPITHKNNNK
eukprot:Filipodium_phascolosomae@DN6112_c0_g1_i1.p1